MLRAFYNTLFRGREDGMIIAFIRTIILYLFIVIGFRILGKRQIGELEPSELVLSLLLADLAAIPMQDLGVPLFGGMLPILTLLCLSSVLSGLTIKSIRLRGLLNGRPSIVVRDGKILAKEMLRNRFTVDELMEELRLSGNTDIEKIKCAILETSGRLSVIPYVNEQPVTANLMNLQTQERGLPLIIISDGRVLEHNLADCGLDFTWLIEQLKGRGIKSPKEVFLMTIDEKKGIYFSLKPSA